jgi:hypothetical protein
LAHGLVTDRHAALSQEFFDITAAETETVIKPDGIRNDLRRKAIASIFGRLCAHRG